MALSSNAFPAIMPIVRIKVKITPWEASKSWLDSVICNHLIESLQESAFEFYFLI